MPNVAIGASVASTDPAVWNIGIELTMASPGRSLSSRPYDRAALLTWPVCRSVAPLGSPVVPDVYWICTGSPGATTGRARAGSVDSRNTGQSSNSTVSRSSGSSARISARLAAIGLPRYSVRRKIPAARDWPRTWRSSAGRSAGSTVTSVSPASAAPICSSSHSGRLLAHTATRSPGANRPSSARAVTSASASSCA